MATKKKSPSRKTNKKGSSPKSQPVVTTSTPSTRTFTFNNTTFTPRFFLYTFLLILLGVGMFTLAKTYRGLVIAGTVNKSIITRWQLNQTLTDRYGQAVLEELINNELLRTEANKQGITVSNEDVVNERQKLVDNLGGEENLQSALLQYGLTEADLNNQIRLRLLQERLAENLFTVEVTDQEVETYFNENESLYEGKELEEVRAEIREGLQQQKLQQEFLTWFNGVKENAQINTYID